MKNIKECTINAYECIWTGKNIKEIERFFRLASYDKYHFVDDDEKLLYDEYALIEKGTTIIANKALGIIAKFTDVE